MTRKSLVEINAEVKREKILNGIDKLLSVGIFEWWYDEKGLYEWFIKNLCNDKKSRNGRITSYYKDKCVCRGDHYKFFGGRTNFFEHLAKLDNVPFNFKQKVVVISRRSCGSFNSQKFWDSLGLSSKRHEYEPLLRFVLSSIPYHPDIGTMFSTKSADDLLCKLKLLKTELSQKNAGKNNPNYGGKHFNAETARKCGRTYNVANYKLWAEHNKIECNSADEYYSMLFKQLTDRKAAELFKSGKFQSLKDARFCFLSDLNKKRFKYSNFKKMVLSKCSEEEICGMGDEEAFKYCHSKMATQKLLDGESNYTFGHGICSFINFNKSIKDVDFVRSILEKEIITYFDSCDMVDRMLIEPRSFQYEINGLKRHYIPDVLLELINRKKVFVEIKPLKLIDCEINQAKAKAMSCFNFFFVSSVSNAVELINGIFSGAICLKD